MLWNRDSSTALCFLLCFKCAGFAEVVVPLGAPLIDQPFSVCSHSSLMDVRAVLKVADLGIQPDILIVAV